MNVEQTKSHCQPHAATVTFFHTVFHSLVVTFSQSSDVLFHYNITPCFTLPVRKKKFVPERVCVLCACDV